MLPLILPGSMLHIATRGHAAGIPAIGDVVCFLDRAQKFVAHRVVAIVGDRGGGKLKVAGDSSGQAEELDEAAVVGVVTRVDHMLLSYETRGALGRLLARWALKRPVSFQGARLAAEALTQLYTTASRFLRRTQRNAL